MPPSEQNQTPVSQPVSNVPEYLHLDPIPEPKPPKSKKKLIASLVAVIFIVIAAIGAVVAWLYMSGEPDRQLYGAIERMMSINYLSQKTVTTLNGKDVRVIETKYDFSNIALPKSHTMFSIATDQVAIKGEYIISGDEYFIKFSQLPDSTSVTNETVVDTWYLVKRSNLERAPAIIRSFGIENNTYPVNGDIIIGNLDQNITSVLMDYIKNQGMYAHEGAVTNGQEITYNVTLDSRRIGELNVKLAEQMNQKAHSRYSAMSKSKSQKIKYVLMVNKQTGNLSRIAQVADESEKEKSALATTLFTYPESISIDLPQDFKEITNE